MSISLYVCSKWMLIVGVWDFDEYSDFKRILIRFQWMFRDFNRSRWDVHGVTRPYNSPTSKIDNHLELCSWMLHKTLQIRLFPIIMVQWKVWVPGRWVGAVPTSSVRPPVLRRAPPISRGPGYQARRFVTMIPFLQASNLDDYDFNRECCFAPKIWTDHIWESGKLCLPWRFCEEDYHWLFIGPHGGSLGGFYFFSASHGRFGRLVKWCCSKRLHSLCVRACVCLFFLKMMGIAAQSCCALNKMWSTSISISKQSCDLKNALPVFGPTKLPVEFACLPSLLSSPRISVWNSPWADEDATTCGVTRVDHPSVRGSWKKTGWESKRFVSYPWLLLWVDINHQNIDKSYGMMISLISYININIHIAMSVLFAYVNHTQIVLGTYLLIGGQFL